MKKLFLLGLMTMLAGSAQAEWRYATSGEAEFFYDPETVRKDKNISKVWSITNLLRRNKDGVFSYRNKYEFNCQDKKFRSLYFSMHTKNLPKEKL